MPGPDLTQDCNFDPETDDFLHWFQTKERKYRHFDDPISKEKLEAGYTLRSYQKAHRFLPLLGFMDEKRRVLRNDENKLVTKIKKRPIRYASHNDAAYIQAYSDYLSKDYEGTLVDRNIAHCVLAYRPTGETNIHHAKSLFDEVKCRQNCYVIAVDISGFFDTLNHVHLRSELRSILNVGKLEGHHWDIFRNITKYAWVDKLELDEVLGKDRKMGTKICYLNEFESHVRSTKTGLVQVHDKHFGIPQGTPVSGLYANIYMLTFDKVMCEFVSNLGGSYRRYSDDIAVVIPSDKMKPAHLVDIVQKILADFHLCLSEDKTDVSEFSGPKLSCDKPIQYLGFMFNGKQITIRESSLRKYREKMKIGIHAKIVAAKIKKIIPTEIYQREVRSRYTHLGKGRNFIRYAYKAADILDAPEIRQQVKGHVRWFNRTWDREVRKVYGIPNFSSRSSQPPRTLYHILRRRLRKLLRSCKTWFIGKLVICRK